MDMKDSDHYNNLLNARRVAEDKLEVLYQQRDQLTSWDEDKSGLELAKTGPIGQLHRGESW